MASTLNKQAKITVDFPSSSADGVLGASVISKAKNEITGGAAIDNLGNKYYNYSWRYGNKYGNAVRFMDDGTLQLTNQYYLPYRWYGRIKKGTYTTSEKVWDTSTRYHWSTTTHDPSYQSGSLFDFVKVANINAGTTTYVDAGRTPSANIGYEIQLYWDYPTNTGVNGYYWAIERGFSGLELILSWYQDFTGTSNYENVVVYNASGTTSLPAGITITPTLYNAEYSVLEPLSESDREAYKLSYPRDAGDSKTLADGYRTVIAKVTFGS